MRKPYGAIPSDPNNRIREHRLAAGMTLEEVGEEMGTTGQSIQRWETTGKVSVDQLTQLAEVLSRGGRIVTPADLVPGGLELDAREQALLDWFRNASSADRRAIFTLARGLAEKDHAEFTTE